MPLDLIAIQKEIKDLVADGKLEKALDLLENTAEELSEEKHNAAVILSSRLHTFKQNSSIGVLSSNEQNLERARISKAILELTDQLDDSEGIIGDDSRTSLLIKALVGIAILTIAGFAINWFTSSNNGHSVNTKVEGQLVFPDGKVASYMIMNFENGKVIDTTDVNGKFSVTLPFSADKTILLDITKAGKTYHDGRIMVGNLNRARVDILSN